MIWGQIILVRKPAQLLVYPGTESAAVSSCWHAGLGSPLDWGNPLSGALSHCVTLAESARGSLGSGSVARGTGFAPGRGAKHGTDLRIPGGSPKPSSSLRDALTGTPLSPRPLIQPGKKGFEASQQYLLSHEEGMKPFAHPGLVLAWRWEPGEARGEESREVRMLPPTRSEQFLVASAGKRALPWPRECWDTPSVSSPAPSHPYSHNKVLWGLTSHLEM
ncbi:uncharacterized protein LOC134054177 [Cinclus cinclus]|uniref:uncharacterized protein LOC134054177 n=1 Tax=Cinclus cinclus TaxID=127875 RepID=UPI002E0F01FA